MDYEDLIKNVQQWAVSKGFDDPRAQFKLEEIQ